MSTNESACLEMYAELFDSIESTPLTMEQRRACVSDAPATLVLAGAGTGKTSTLTGRVAFLLAHGLAAAQDILCLAFAREAAQEIHERLQRRIAVRLSIQGFSASTFHSLGLQIVMQVEQQRPMLTDFCHRPEALREFLDQQLRERINHCDQYTTLLLDYFALIEPGIRLSCEFSDRQAYLTSFASRPVRALRGELMRNPFECLVANALCLMGVEYCYRQHFPHNVFFAKRQPYRSTFYLPVARIYIDVFDYAGENKAPTAIRKWVRRLNAIHKHYDTRHVLLWEETNYAYNIQSLINDLQCRISDWPDPAPDRNGLQYHKHDEAGISARNERSLAAARQACMTMLIGSDRWEALLSKLAGLLPLYRLSHSSHLSNCDAVGTAITSGVIKGQIPATCALLAPLSAAYEQRLSELGHIDFDGMIARATKYVREGRFQVPWRDILIDEFQDISSHRYGLIAAVLHQRSDLRLFCVGDDWQAIYRFAGSDIRYTTHFSERVHPQCRIVPLSCTFRFSQALCDISSRFLMKNPFQNGKRLQAASKGNARVVTLVRQTDGVDTVLARLQQSTAGSSSLRRPLQQSSVCQMKTSILLLARFSHLLPDQVQLAEFARRYPALQIQSSTVHASKGLEADYVCILNMEQGVYGFPSDKAIDQVREYFLPESENFEFADERRLFYVALTRARNHVWLMVPDEADKISIFVKELLRDNRRLVNADYRDCLSIPVVRRKPEHGLIVEFGDERSTDRQKLAISRVTDKIKRLMVRI